MAITTDEFNNKVEEIACLRADEAEAGRVKKDISDRLEAAESKMLEMLTEAGLKNYRSPIGLVSISYRTSVKTPKTLEAKTLLFDYLKSKNLYDEMVSVNSQTLNSFYKAELKEAQERGADDFQVPGLTEVTIDANLSFRRD